MFSSNTSLKFVYEIEVKFVLKSPFGELTESNSSNVFGYLKFLLIDDCTMHVQYIKLEIKLKLIYF